MTKLSMQFEIRNAAELYRTRLVKSPGSPPASPMETERALSYAAGWLAFGLDVSTGTARRLLLEELQK